MQFPFKDAARTVPNYDKYFKMSFPDQKAALDSIDDSEKRKDIATLLFIEKRRREGASNEEIEQLKQQIASFNAASTKIENLNNEQAALKKLQNQNDIEFEDKTKELILSSLPQDGEKSLPPSAYTPENKRRCCTIL